MQPSITLEPAPGKLRTLRGESLPTIRGYRAVIADGANKLYTTSVCLTEVIAERAAKAWIRANLPAAVAAA